MKLLLYTVHPQILTSKILNALDIFNTINVFDDKGSSYYSSTYVQTVSSQMNELLMVPFNDSTWFSYSFRTFSKFRKGSHAVI